VITGALVLLLSKPLTEQVIGLAITVHRHTGPGLLVSVYVGCLCREPDRAELAFARQIPVPVIYREEAIGDGFRADIVVENTVIVEVKAVAALLPQPEAQLRTYLCMSGLRVGLLMNFKEPRLIDGLRRFVV
jgi:GxxExxY protein